MTQTQFNSPTGKLICLFEPERTNVSVIDIAHSLARQCRFGGNIRPDVWHYSVAQHSVLVSRLCSPKNALVGLLHDAAEAYCQDLTCVLKPALPCYRKIEHAWAVRISRSLGVDILNLPPEVDKIDKAIAVVEKQQLVLPAPPPGTPSALEVRIEPWSAERAFNEFMRCFRECQDGT